MRRFALIFALFVATRLLGFAALTAGSHFRSEARQQEWAWDPSRSDLEGAPGPPAILAPIFIWDARFYIAIARTGYPAARATPVYHANFFPLYPLAVRAASALVGDVFVAALLVSNLAAFLASLLVFRLGATGPGAGRSDGWFAAALFLCAPGSHFLSMPYTEGLFALAVAAASWALVRDRIACAGLFGALASATRATGVAIAGSLLLLALLRRRDLRGAAACVASALLALSGIAAYSCFAGLRYGDPLLFIHLQADGFHRALHPLGPIIAFMRFEADPDYYLFTIAALILAFREWRLLLPKAGEPEIATQELALAGAGAVLLWLPLFSSTLKAMIRYQAATVPLIARAGMALKRNRALILGACLASMCLEAFLFGAGLAHY